MSDVFNLPMRSSIDHRTDVWVELVEYQGMRITLSLGEISGHRFPARSQLHPPLLSRLATTSTTISSHSSSIAFAPSFFLLYLIP